MTRWIFGLALIATSAAWADELPAFHKAAPSPTPAVAWTGFYIGANVGYGWHDPTVDFTGNSFALTTYFGSGAVPSGVPVDPKSVMGGLQAGYNRQFGRWLLGVEADLDTAAIRDSASASTGVFIAANPASICVGFPCTISSYQYAASATQKLDAFGTLRARGGVVIGDRWLAFATGGLAFGDAELTAGVTNTSGLATTHIDPVTSTVASVRGCIDICASGTNAKWLVGWTIGGGFEYAFDDRWSIKGEYLYYNLGRMSVTFADSRTPTLGLYTFTASADYVGQIVRIGANFKLY